MSFVTRWGERALRYGTAPGLAITAAQAARRKLRRKKSRPAPPPPDPTDDVELEDDSREGLVEGDDVGLFPLAALAASAAAPMVKKAAGNLIKKAAGGSVDAALKIAKIKKASKAGDPAAMAAEQALDNEQSSMVRPGKRKPLSQPFSYYRKGRGGHYGR